MKISYQAFDGGGKRVAGSIEAAGADEARELLRRRGLFVTEIDGDSAAPSNSRQPGGQKRPRLSAGKRLKNLCTFARQMHVLTASGTPVMQALAAIERQSQDKEWRGVVEELRTRIEAGGALSDAMAAKPHYFDPVCRSLLAAGEASGSIVAMFERLAALTRKQLHLRSTITGAMIYPCLLLCLGVAVVIVMLMFVLPRFSVLFESLDSPLPPTTKFLLALSALLKDYWWALLGGGTAMIVGGRYWYVSGPGRAIVGTRILTMPKLGKLIQNMVTARISRLLGILIESGVPLIDALQLARNAAGSPAYDALLTRAEDAVSRGEPLSSVLSETPLINPAVQEALRNGEQSGRIGAPLSQMADFLDEENDIVVKTLTSLLEPAILIVLGVVVAFMAMSMFLPMFDLVSATSGGGK